MCETCAPTEIISSASGRRLRLPDLDSGWYCTIIGTCLSMAELRRLAGRQGAVFPMPNPTDYEMHAGMIQLAGRERGVAKAMSKLLDQKYVVAINRFRRAGSETELMALWRAAVEQGDVAGGCWALMSHPAATEELRSLVFGEIHMLSHQVGASTRADMKRLHEVQKAALASEAKLAALQERARKDTEERDAVIRDLKDRLEREQAESRRLGFAASAASELAALKGEVGEWRRRAELDADGRRKAEAARKDAEQRAADIALELSDLRQDLNEARSELAALEGRVHGLLDGACGQSCGRTDLCGRCILYVGGRGLQIQHLRRLVEECNGTFIHHDGGFEESMGRLSGLMGQADAVVFPVDCVSHSAHDHLKRLCKRWSKPFVPVRRSGLGAFMRALEAVAQPEDLPAAE